MAFIDGLLATCPTFSDTKNVYSVQYKKAKRCQVLSCSSCNKKQACSQNSSLFCWPDCNLNGELLARHYQEAAKNTTLEHKNSSNLFFSKNDTNAWPQKAGSGNTSQFLSICKLYLPFSLSSCNVIGLSRRATCWDNEAIISSLCSYKRRGQAIQKRVS